jgi:hypothetical protein
VRKVFAEFLGFPLWPLCPMVPIVVRVGFVLDCVAENLKGS